MKRYTLSKSALLKHSNSPAKLAIQNYFISQGNELVKHVIDKSNMQYPFYAHKVIKTVNNGLYLFSKLNQQLYDLNSEKDLKELSTNSGIYGNSSNSDLLRSVVIAELPSENGVVIESNIQFSEGDVPVMHVFDGRSRILKISPGYSEICFNGTDNIYYKRGVSASPFPFNVINRKDPMNFKRLLQPYGLTDKEYEAVKMIKDFIAGYFLKGCVTAKPLLIMKTNSGDGIPLILKILGTVLTREKEINLIKNSMSSMGIQLEELQSISADMKRLKDVVLKGQPSIIVAEEDVEIPESMEDTILIARDIDPATFSDAEHFLTRVKATRLSLLNDGFITVQDRLKEIQVGEYKSEVKTVVTEKQCLPVPGEVNKIVTVVEDDKKENASTMVGDAGEVDDNNLLLVKLIQLWISTNDDDRFILNGDLRKELIQVADDHDIQFTFPKAGAKWGKHLSDRRKELEKYFLMKWEYGSGKQKKWLYRVK